MLQVILLSFDIFLMFFFCSKNNVLENVLFIIIEHQYFAVYYLILGEFSIFFSLQINLNSKKSKF